MSLEQKVKIQCPNCKKEGDFEIYDSLNVQMDPQQKNKLITGEMFVYKCPYCGKETLVNYGLLYHDMDKKIIIQYATNDDERKLAEDMLNGVGFEKIKDGDKIKDSFAKYTKRIVESQEALAEKVSILDSGLDDKVIELIKLMYLQMFYKENPNEEVKEERYVEDEGERLIVFVTKEDSFAMALDEKLYEVMTQNLKELNSEDNLYIDSNWAIETFEKLMIME